MPNGPAMTAFTGEGSIAIQRDENDVPHIRATTEADLRRGLGWCHASERGIQLLLTRLAGRGRMAKHLRGGDDLLAIDRRCGAWTSRATQRRSWPRSRWRTSRSSTHTATA